MFRSCGIIGRGCKRRKLFNSGPKVREQNKKLWKVHFGNRVSERTFAIRDVKDCIIEKYQRERGSKRAGDRDLEGLTSTVKYIMKQISTFKKKLSQGKKAVEVLTGKQYLQQNGQPTKKKVKKPFGKKSGSVEAPIKHKLNVNERPIRKKKKTKKYESYERNGKSPEPEVKYETNLLLALGLTPIKKPLEEDGMSHLNRMHIMEEGNAKVTGDVAELPQTQADLPKKADAQDDRIDTASRVDSVILPDMKDIALENSALATLKVNGLTSDEGHRPGKKNLLEKFEQKEEENGIAGNGFVIFDFEMKKKSEKKVESFHIKPKEDKVKLKVKIGVSEYENEDEKENENKYVSESESKCKNENKYESESENKNENDYENENNKKKENENENNKKKENENENEKEKESNDNDIDNHNKFKIESSSSSSSSSSSRSSSNNNNNNNNEKDTDKISEPHDLTVTCTQNLENAMKTSQNEKHYTNDKIISISVEQCQTNPTSVNCVLEESSAEKVKKPKAITSRKRSTKSTDSEESFKISYKRTKFADIENEDRERTVSEYVERASGSSLEELQINTEKLQQEIHSLSALARAKELEWNDLIRLKKVKEEIYLRLVRRKQVMLLSMGGSGRMSDSSAWDFALENRMTDFVTNDEVSYNRVTPSVSPKPPPPRLPSNLTITKSQSSPSQNLQRFLMQPQGASDCKPNTSLMMVPIVSSTPITISSTSSYLPKPHLGTPLKIPIPDRDKLKVASGRNVPVPILPKPNQSVNNNVNNHSPPIGRQGPIVDVKSIIADYRQNHPEQVPRRGRRPKGQPSQNFAETMVSSGRGVLSMSSLALGSGAHVRTVTSNPELVSGQESSRPSSADSNRSSSNAPLEASAAVGVSFKDVLVQFAKMSQNQQGDRRNTTPPVKTQAPSKPPPYPEVTLHPVLPAGVQSPPNSSSSLLHGILTKTSSPANIRDNQHCSRSTTFSPTLARLLTTPDKSSISTTITTALRGSNAAPHSSRVASGPVSITDLLSTSKNRNELTITPIISNLQPAKVKEDTANASDEDPDDNADRLVIDESEEHDTRIGDEEEMDSETVPECQGCHMKSAQFVCAGCGNQWYCSRNCQVTAWDEHSEVCSG